MLHKINSFNQNGFEKFCETKYPRNEFIGYPFDAASFYQSVAQLPYRLGHLNQPEHEKIKLYQKLVDDIFTIFSKHFCKTTLCSLYVKGNSQDYVVNALTPERFFRTLEDWENQTHNNFINFVLKKENKEIIFCFPATELETCTWYHKIKKDNDDLETIDFDSSLIPYFNFVTKNNTENPLLQPTFTTMLIPLWLEDTLMGALALGLKTYNAFTDANVDLSLNNLPELLSLTEMTTEILGQINS